MASCGCNLGEAQAFITHRLGAHGGWGTLPGSGDKTQNRARPVRWSQSGEQAMQSCRCHRKRLHQFGWHKQRRVQSPWWRGGASDGGGHQEAFLVEMVLELRLYLLVWEDGREAERLRRGKYRQEESTEASTARLISVTYWFLFVCFIKLILFIK